MSLTLEKFEKYAQKVYKNWDTVEVKKTRKRNVFEAVVTKQKERDGVMGVLESRFFYEYDRKTKTFEQTRNEHKFKPK